MQVSPEFLYLHGVDSIELRTLFYLWKMCRDHHWHWKNTKSKSGARRCQFCWYLTCILTIRLRAFSITRSLKVNDSSFKQAAVWSPWRDVTNFITLRHNVLTTWAKRQLPRALSRIWKKTATNDIRFPTMWYVRPAKTQISLLYTQSDQSLY